VLAEVSQLTITTAVMSSYSYILYCLTNKQTNKHQINTFSFFPQFHNTACSLGQDSGSYIMNEL